MRTLFLRNVADDVVTRLERLASLAGTSVNVIAVRELERSGRNADSPALLGSLPNLGIEPGDIVSGLHADREVR